MVKANCKRKQICPYSLANLKSKVETNSRQQLNTMNASQKKASFTKTNSCPSNFEFKKKQLEIYIEKVFENRQSNKHDLGLISFASVDEKFVKRNLSLENNNSLIDIINELTIENCNLKSRVEALQRQKCELELFNTKLLRDKKCLDLALTEKSSEIISLNQLANNLRTKLLEINTKGVESFQADANTRGKRKLSSVVSVQTSRNSKRRRFQSSDAEDQNSPHEHSESEELSVDAPLTLKQIKNKTIDTPHTSEINESFKLVGIKPLDQKILFKIKNNSNDEKIISLKTLRNKEQNECQKMIDWATLLVMNEYNRKVSFSHISKISKGFIVQLICSSHKSCDSYWTIRINLVTKAVNLICNKLCKHNVSSTPLEKSELAFQTTRPLSIEIWQSLNNRKNSMLPKKSDLNQEQSEELNFVCQLMKEQLHSIGIESSSEYVSKTKNGYKFSRRCNKRKCRSAINLKVNVKNGSGLIFFKEKCLRHH